MATFNIKEYARRGAEARITELNAELEAIYRAFPDMRPRARGGRAAAGRAQAGAPRRGPRSMSAAQRRAVSRRMKKYWAARRNAKTGKASAA